MRVLKNTVIKKILIVLMAIISINSFIMPNYVCAKESVGETLVNALSYLVAWVGDTGIKVMQRIMIGTDDIEELNLVTNKNEYAIKYSPGLIFSNSVPALDVNFISASASDNDSIKRLSLDVENKDDYVDLIEKAHLTENDFDIIYEGNIDNKEEAYEILEANGIGIGNSDEGIYFIFHNESDSYKWSLENWGDFGRMSKAKVILKNKPGGTLKWLDMIYFYFHKGNLYVLEHCRGRDTSVLKCCQKSTLINKLGGTSNAEVIELESTAYKLKPYISTWYNALRTLALVGLLSVLLYLGIRIILSSTSAQDKAKYKSMLKDWLVAICILFVLHYTMAFMLEISSSLIKIIKGNVVKITNATNNTDELMNTVRTNLGDYKNSSGSQTFGYAVMYLALVFLTGMFTIQYLKRVVYMAFLTMIAPLIALTYPLDKVKDGKAQAFNFWLKEYIFNCLIQPVHLLLYTIFIVNAMDFAKVNVLYSIVALAFMVPAEKIIKEMFGMKSNSPSGTLGAAAGGALVMSMMNKMKSKGPKGDNSGHEPSGVRTATRTPSSDGAVAPQNQVPMAQNTSAGGTKAAAKTGAGGTGSGTGSSAKANKKQSKTSTNSGSSTSQSGNRYSIGRGIREISGVNSLIGAPGKRFIPAALNGIGNGLKKAIKAGGELGAAALGGTVMLANEIADGHLFDDPEKAVSNIAGAGVAGYMAGQGIEGRLGETVEKFNRGAMGEEAYNNSKFDKQFYESKGYRDIAQDSGVKSMCKQMKVSVHEATQQFLDNGITDASQIKMALQNGLNGDTFAEYNKQGITSPTDVVELMQNGIGVQNLKDIKTYGGETDAKKMMRYNTIAKAAKSDGVPQNETAFINWARTKHKMDDEEAKKLFKNVKFYWN